jgi:hypothetical protein
VDRLGHRGLPAASPAAFVVTDKILCLQILKGTRGLPWFYCDLADRHDGDHVDNSWVGQNGQPLRISWPSDWPSD